MKNGRPHFMSDEAETPVCSFRRSSRPSTGLRAVECVPHPRAVCPASPPLGPPSEAAEPVVLSRKGGLPGIRVLRDTGGIKGADSLLLGKLSEKPSLRDGQMTAG